MRISIVLGVALLSLSTGCGGSSTKDSPGTGAVGGAAGSGGSGGSSGSGGSGAYGASGGSGGDTCADYADEAPQTGVTFMLRNKRTTPIYLGGESNCGPAQLFTVDGESGSVQLQAGGCGNTCEALQQHGDFCTGACLLPPVIRIDPGGSYATNWDGTSYESRNMPTSCYVDLNTAASSCDQRIIVADGSYTATVGAATDIVCNDVGICDCSSDENGSCEIQSAALDGIPIEAKATLSWPSASVIDVVFE